MYQPSKNALALMAFGMVIHAALMCSDAFCKKDYIWVIGSGLVAVTFGLATAMSFFQPEGIRAGWRSNEIGFELALLLIVLSILFIKVTKSLMASREATIFINETQRWEMLVAVLVTGAGMLMMFIENIIKFSHDIDD